MSGVSRSPSPDKRRETLPLVSDQPKYGTDGAGRTYAQPAGEQMVTIPASLLNEMMALAAKGSGVSEQESTIEYQDGTRYIGAVRDGKPHGRGTLNFTANQNCQRFDGVFQLGLMRQGKMLYTNGERYEGEFENSLPHGQGRYFFANGDIYTGQFTQGKITGRGHYKFVNGETYEGMVLNNKLHGQGVYRCPNGMVHTGNFFNDLAEGEGVKRMVVSSGIATEKGIFHRDKLWNGIYIGGNGYRTVYHQGKEVFDGFLGSSYEEWAARYLPRPVPGGVAGSSPMGTYNDDCFCNLI
jgi:hypothetical protein